MSEQIKSPGGRPGPDSTRASGNPSEQFSEYCRNGLALVRVTPGNKKPTGTAWSSKANAITDPAKAAGLKAAGLAHLFSRTCAVDVDDFHEASDVLDDGGIELMELLAADDAVKIEGNPKRAKLVYRLPESVDWLPTFKLGKNNKLELRCASKDGSATVQDVLPPSIHPGTGQPYKWRGDWRNIPTLPDPLLAFWLKHAAANLASPVSRPKSSDAGLIGKFNEAHTPGDILERNGYQPAPGNRWLSPTSESGSPGVITFPDDPGRVYSHHSDALGSGKSHDSFSLFTVLEHGGNESAAIKAAAKLGKQDPDGAAIAAALMSPAPIDADAILPPFPDELIRLPHGAGALQDWVYNRAKYPSKPAAGVTALFILSTIAMPKLTVDSYDGLGLNEQWGDLRPTGSGKDCQRRAVIHAHESVRKALEQHPEGNLLAESMAALQSSLPASQQALHKQLEANRCQSFIADEAFENLAAMDRDIHRRQMMGHLMTCYTSATGMVAPPQSIQGQYKPVYNPRVGIWMSSTLERALEVINGSQAAAGTWNRVILVVGEQRRIKKRYSGQVYELPADLLDLLVWIAAQNAQKEREGQVCFSGDAWALFVEHDSQVIEPLKFADNQLAGRLSEQAIKIAALLALSDRRKIIQPDDLATAYRIREGLYHRIKKVADDEGLLTGNHPTTKAVEQLTGAFTRHPSLYQSQLAAFSTAYRDRLTVAEQNAVLNALIDRGICKTPDDAKTRATLVSLVY